MTPKGCIGGMAAWGWWMRDRRSTTQQRSLAPAPGCSWCCLNNASWFNEFRNWAKWTEVHTGAAWMVQSPQRHWMREDRARRVWISIERLLEAVSIDQLRDFSNEANPCTLIAESTAKWKRQKAGDPESCTSKLQKRQGAVGQTELICSQSRILSYESWVDETWFHFVMSLARFMPRRSKSLAASNSSLQVWQLDPEANSVGALRANSMWQVCVSFTLLIQELTIPPKEAQEYGRSISLPIAGMDMRLKQRFFYILGLHQLSVHSWRLDNHHGGNIK